MKTTWALLIVTLFQLGLNAATGLKSDSGHSLEMAVDAILSDYTGVDRPGATIGIIENGKIVFQKGYGMADLSSGEANGPDVVYNIASGSKQFTASVVATLIDEEKLFLSDDIRKYLPGFPTYEATITIENLLYHTSGIRDYMVLMWLTGRSFEGPFSNADAINLIARQGKLNFSPNHRCVYSNSNYVLLAEIVRRVTEMSLSDYARQSVFEDLGMNSSIFGNSNEGNSARAVSYWKSGDTYLAYGNDYAAYGAGGMRTTLEDLARWDKGFYDNTSSIQKILKKGTLINGNVLSYGMGIMFNTYRNESIQTHPGAFLGFRFEMLRFPDKNISIICLGNSENINPESITREIADVYVFGEDKKSEEAPSGKVDSGRTVSAEMAETFTGVYEVAPNVFVHVRYENGAFSGQVTGQPRQILQYEGDNVFNVISTGDKVAFSNFDSGQFQLLAVIQKEGSTAAKRLRALPVESFVRYSGSYYSEEQDTRYQFFSRDGSLWFKVGSNAEVKTEILVNYNRMYFDYKNLEQATIEFSVNASGNVDGFTLNSSRVSGIQFAKETANSN